MCELIRNLGSLRIKFLGDHRGEDPPDPISNSEVKLAIADGTARVTLWESRSSPGIQFRKKSAFGGLFFCVGSNQRFVHVSNFFSFSVSSNTLLE